MTSLTELNPERTSSGNFDQNGLDSDEELVKVGEIELKDPFRNIEIDEGTVVAVRKITKVTTLKRQRSRASSFADPERGEDEAETPDPGQPRITDPDSQGSSSSDEDQSSGDEDKGNPDGKYPGVFLDVGKRDRVEYMPETKNKILIDNKYYQSSDTLSVDRTHAQDHTDVTKDVEFVVRNSFRSETTWPRPAERRDTSLPSSPGSAKRRLSSINNPDYFNHIWRPILGKDKKPNDDQDDEVYWRVVNEKSTQERRMISNEENRRMTQTEDRIHLRDKQDKQDHTIYNTSKVKLNEDYDIYYQSAVNDMDPRESDNSFYDHSTFNIQKEETEQGFYDHSSRQEPEAERNVGNGLYDLAVATRQDETRVAEVERYYEQSVRDEQHSRQISDDRLYSRSSSPVDQGQDLVEPRLYAHSNAENQQTLTNTEITQQLTRVVNTNYRHDMSTSNRSLQNGGDSRQSTLRGSEELRESIMNLEQSESVRKVLTERDGLVTNSLSSQHSLHQTPQTEIAWRDPDLAEVIEYLTHHDDVIRINAAAYLQHLSYMNEDVKQQIRELGGIPLLVQLLNTDIPELHQVACGALRNLSYSTVTEETKRAIAHAGGIGLLTRLLHRTKDARLQEVITAILWNISSVKDLKRPLLDESLSVLVGKILIPSSGWRQDEQVFSVNTFRVVYCSVLLRNATGILRNVSSDGCHARMKMRQCEGLIESLILIVQSASGKTDVNNKCVENSVCILRNMTYCCQEFVDPEYKTKETAKKSVNGKKRETSTCCGTKTKSPKPAEDPEAPRNPITITGDKGVALLWSSQVASMYLSILYDCSNMVTLEAASGAIQNLCCCDWQLSDEIRQTIRKEKGLAVFVDLLMLQSDKVVCSSAAALRNLVINEQNRQLIAKYAMTQLISCLPKKSETSEFSLSTNSLSALLTLIYNVVQRSTEASRLMTTGGGTDKLMYILRSERFDYQPRVYASMILTAMWQCTELRDMYSKHGWTEQDFMAKPIHPQNLKSRRKKIKKTKKNQSNQRTDNLRSDASVKQHHAADNVTGLSRDAPGQIVPYPPTASLNPAFSDDRPLSSGYSYKMNQLSVDMRQGDGVGDPEDGHMSQREYIRESNSKRFDSETALSMETFRHGNSVSTQDPIHSKVHKTSYTNHAFQLADNEKANGKDADSWV